MPAGSNAKRERQFEHIKESYEKRGQKGRAEEIAARTVNKERAEHGEAKKSSATRGGERTRAQLYQEAQRRGISGRSAMNKAQLQRALSH